MTAVASVEALKVVALRLHAKLYAPAHARERRVAELGFLSKLLDEIPHEPGHLAVIERQIYDERHVEAPEAPLSARLTERYGSWRRACYAAWTLRQDGRWTEGGFPWTTLSVGEAQSRPYTVEEAIEAVRLATDSLGFVPSSTQYTRWQQSRKVKARSKGLVIRLPRHSRICQLLAPSAAPGQGWRHSCKAALERPG